MPEQKPDFRARSPWASLNGVTSAQIHLHNEPVNHSLSVPGSKSFTNRALILAGLAQGSSTLTGILRSDDAYWCIDSLRNLGLTVEVEDDVVVVHGRGGDWPNKQVSLYIGAAGTTARFLPGALAAAKRGRWEIDGSTRLRERPLKPLLDALAALGAHMESVMQPERLPLIIHGGGLQGGHTTISGSTSSQFISGLLLASPYAANPVTIRVTDKIVQEAYVRITLEMMKDFGVPVHYDHELTTFYIEPGSYQGSDVTLEADASTACYFFALAAITKGTITVTNLKPQSHQPDVRFVDILRQMGCIVKKNTNAITVQGPEQLQGGMTISMTELSDQALTLAAIAPYADAPIRITDVAHIRHHESDRIHVAAENLTRLGIHCEEHTDGFTVYPGSPQPAELPSYDDHRVAMSFSILGARSGGVTILDPGCVSKTCPNFFDILTQLGVSIDLK